MAIDIGEVQDSVESAYHRGEDCNKESEELRRILGLQASQGTVASCIYEYLVMPSDVSRESLRIALRAFMVTVIGQVSYYGFDIKDLLEDVCVLLTEDMEGKK